MPDLSEMKFSAEPFRLSVVDWVMAFENGEMDDWMVIEGFQQLIDSGMVWSLQGSYGRAAKALIEAGLCHNTS